MLLASSSPKESTFIFHEFKNSGIRETIITGATTDTSFILTDERLPISQKVISGNLDSLSAIYFNRAIRALKRALMTIPERTRVRIRSCRKAMSLLQSSEILTAVSPAANADSWMSGKEAEQVIANAAPNPAPLLTPRISGLTIGLRNKP